MVPGSPSLHSASRFEQEELWGQLTEAPDIRLKTTQFLQMIPGDVRTIVDVGCGDGAITNRLAESYEVTAVDSSRAALAHVATAKVVGDATTLPFAERSFDLVMSSQMLEHLQDAAYRRALREICRVSRRYVLISVPYREALIQRQIRCPRCGWRGHVWGHRRSFTIDSLLSDLVSFSARDVRVFGDLQEPPWPRPALWLLHNVIHAFYWPGGQSPMCEQCGNTDWSGARGLPPPKLKRWLTRFSSRPWVPFWLAVLAERRSCAGCPV
jgi:SAM-dependent methyltransferase